MKTIYTLSDPTTNYVKYIGVTSNVNLRKKQHNNISNVDNLERRDWILSLRKINLKPIFEELETVITDGYEEEKYWISQLKSMGFELFNKTIGGSGFTGKHSQYSKNLAKENTLRLNRDGKNPRLGKTHSEYSKLLMSKPHRRIKPIEEVSSILRKSMSVGVYSIYKNDILIGEFVSANEAFEKTNIPSRSVAQLSTTGKVGKQGKCKGFRVVFTRNNKKNE